MADAKLAHSELTNAIIKAFYNVYNRLGYGFTEQRYALALERELHEMGHHVAREYSTRVYYKGVEVGHHRLDMVVDLLVAVEIKSTEFLASYARRQLLNYLRATNLEVGLLLHFGPKPRFDRIFVPNDPANRPRLEKRSPFQPPADINDEEAVERWMEEMDRRITESFESDRWSDLDDDWTDEGEDWKRPKPPDDPPAPARR